MRAGRRRLLAFFGGVLAGPALPQPARPGKRRIGVLTPSDRQWEEAAFRQELRRLGYDDARLEVLVRSAKDDLRLLPSLALELAKAPVDVLVAANTPGGRAAAAATKAIPIVVGVVSEPSLVGVRNISRPEGNVTGVTNMAGEIVGKRLEVLKETLPTASRIAVLIHPDEPIVKLQMRDLAPAADALRLELRYLPVRSERDLRAAIADAVAWRADALFRLAGQAGTHSRLTAQLALEHRLPAMLLTSSEVSAGALLSYFADHPAIWRRVAQYADRLLNGVQVAELPFERPTVFELAVNLRTARALGVAIPQSVLLRAHRVVE